MSAQQRVSIELIANLQKISITCTNPNKILQLEQDKNVTFYVQLCLEDKLSKEKQQIKYTRFSRFDKKSKSVEWQDAEKVVLGSPNVLLVSKLLSFTVFTKNNDSIELVGVPFVLKLKNLAQTEAKQFTVVLSDDFQICVKAILQQRPSLIHCGFLQKQGNKRKNWKKRWFELDNNMELHYYKYRKETNQYELKGTLMVDHNTLVEIPQHSAINLNSDEQDEENVINVVKLKQEELMDQAQDLDMSVVQECYKNYALDEEYNKLQQARYKQRTAKTPMAEKKSIAPPIVVNSQYIFQVHVALSFSADQEHRNRKHVLVADNEAARLSWTDLISQCVIEKKRRMNDESQSLLFEQANHYDTFVKHITTMPPSDLIEALDIIFVSDSEKLVCPLIMLFDAQTTSIDLIQSAITFEITNNKSAQTLFRRNSISSKLVALFFKLHGMSYLKNTLGSLIDAIISENKHCEIDPTRLKGETPDQILTDEEKKNICQENYKNLFGYCQAVVQAILSSFDKCPSSICKVLHHMYTSASKAYPEQAGEISAGGLLFLRFFCPAITSPHLFTLTKNNQPAPEPAARTLTLVTKVLQNIANQAAENKKELYMNQLLKFTTESIDSIKMFLIGLSAPNDKPNPNVVISSELQLQVLQILHKQLYYVHEKSLFENQTVPTVSKLNTIFASLKMIQATTNSHSLGRQQTFKLTSGEMNSHVKQADPYMLLAAQSLQVQTRQQLLANVKNAVKDILSYFKRRTEVAETLVDLSKMANDKSSPELQNLIRKKLVASILAICEDIEDAKLQKTIQGEETLQLIQLFMHPLSPKQKFCIYICHYLNEKKLDSFIKSFVSEDCNKALCYLALLNKIPYKMELQLVN